MLDLSFLGEETFLGRTLRSPIRRLVGRYGQGGVISSTAEVRILQGPMRGKKWIAGSSTAGCWLGFFEASKQKKLASYVRPGMTCYDVGANVGFYTLLFWSITGLDGSVAAFEPLPENCLLLNRHMAMNKCASVRVFPCAISNVDGISRFERGQYTTNGHLSEAGELEIRSYRLDTCVTELNLKMPDVIKIDVEGAEVEVLEGASNILHTAKPVIFLATHGEKPHADCCGLLISEGYELQCLEGGPIESASEIVAFPRR